MQKIMYHAAKSHSQSQSRPLRKLCMMFAG